MTLFTKGGTTNKSSIQRIRKPRKIVIADLVNGDRNQLRDIVVVMLSNRRLNFRKQRFGGLDRQPKLFRTFDLPLPPVNAGDGLTDLCTGCQFVFYQLRRQQLQHSAVIAGCPNDDRFQFLFGHGQRAK